MKAALQLVGYNIICSTFCSISEHTWCMACAPPTGWLNYMHHPHPRPLVPLFMKDPSHLVNSNKAQRVEHCVERACEHLKDLRGLDSLMKMETWIGSRPNRGRSRIGDGGYGSGKPRVGARKNWIEPFYATRLTMDGETGDGTGYFITFKHAWLNGRIRFGLVRGWLR